MRQSTKILIVIGLVLAMLLSGLLLPALIERLAGGADGTMETLQVEALTFDGGSSSVIEILQRLSADANGWNTAADRYGMESNISLQDLSEGYQFTKATAAAHVRELITDYLANCRLKDASEYYATHFDELPFDLNAYMVVAADYPVPWSAILWIAEGADGSFEVLFDDASGALLSCSIPVYGEEENPEAIWAKLGQYTYDAIGFFAEQLGAGLSYTVDADTGLETIFQLVGEDGEAVDMQLIWMEDYDARPILSITYELDGMMEVYDAYGNDIASEEKP